MSRQKSHDVKLLPNWDLVIEESVRQLKICESRAVQLRVCVEYFHKRKASGDPSPGIEIEGADSRERRAYHSNGNTELRVTALQQHRIRAAPGAVIRGADSDAHNNALGVRGRSGEEANSETNAE